MRGFFAAGFDRASEAIKRLMGAFVPVLGRVMCGRCCYSVIECCLVLLGDSMFLVYAACLFLVLAPCPSFRYLIDLGNQ